MNNKTYMVVLLPNDSNTGTIEINRADIFEDFDAAYERFAEFVQESGGSSLFHTPKYPHPLDFAEYDGGHIQLWIVNTPLNNNTHS